MDSLQFIGHVNSSCLCGAQLLVFHLCRNRQYVPKISYSKKPDALLLMGNQLQTSTKTKENGDQQEMAHRESENEPVEEEFYDMVLSCRLHDLCDPLETEEGASSSDEPRRTSLGHWKLQLDKGGGKDRDLSHWHGHVVGILGHYNRGKTWVMGRLSDYTFPSEGMTIRTEGMSFKWIETKSTKGSSGAGKPVDVRWHLAIDTAGFNTPITLNKPTSPSKAMAYTCTLILPE